MERINPTLNLMPKPTYTISAVNTNGSSEFPRPECLPQAGDVLVVEKPLVTQAGYFYQVGSRLRLIERTQDAPFGLLSSLGNWVVECPFQKSVWTNIELMIAEGTLSYGMGPGTREWLPISTAPEFREPCQMFVVIAMDVTIGNSNHFTTDPCCVWRKRSGEFVRGPWEIGPTHWMPLPYYNPETRGK